jgi:hypothetical protein
MPAETSIPYWAAALYGLLGAAGVVVGGSLVARDKLAHQSASGVWPGVGAGFLLALGVLGALPEACEWIDSVPIGAALAAASFLAVLFAHGAGHRESGGHRHGAVGHQRGAGRGGGEIEHEHEHEHGHAHAHEHGEAG